MIKVLSHDCSGKSRFLAAVALAVPPEIPALAESASASLFEAEEDDAGSD